MSIRTFIIGEEIEYHETKVKDSIVNKYYEIRNHGNEIESVPDGCVDLQFIVDDGKVTAYVCGSFLEGTKSSTGKYGYCFGIKFNPGVMPESLGINAAEIWSSRTEVSMNAFDTCEFYEKILDGASFDEKVSCFETMFSSNWEGGNQVLVSRIIKKVRQANGHLVIAEMSNDMGYSQKYLDRVFRERMGMSIKKFAEIVRIQKAISLLKRDNTDDIYDELGFYDQAHFIKTFKRYTQMTPRQFKVNCSHVTIV